MRLIDVDTININDTVRGNNDFAECIRDAVKTTLDNALTVNAIIIPEGATNGDMIKAIFNPYKIFKGDFNVSVYMTERNFEESDYQMNYDRRWWDAPYEGGRKNDE